MLRSGWLLVGGLGLVGGLVLLGWQYWAHQLPSPSSESLWPRLATYALYEAGSGQAVRPQALEGQVVLLAFVYTRCASVCPRLSSALRALLAQTRPEDPVTAVSISLDPERDVGPQLQAYQQAYGVPGRRWYYWRTETQAHAFLLARDLFGVMAASLPDQEIMHTDAFFLVDCQGRLFGPYNSQSVDIAKSHLQKLIRLCGKQPL